METPENWSSMTAQEHLTLKFRMEQDDEKRVEVPVPSVVVQGHEVEASALPKQPREVRALLESQGRKVKTRHSATILPGVPFKSGPRKGDLRPDKLTDHYSLATVDHRLPVVLAYWDNGDNMWYCKFATTWEDRTTVRLVTELKELLEETDAEHKVESQMPVRRVGERAIPGRKDDHLP